MTSLPKLDAVKQSKYDEMLSQLSSDVITPPPMKPKITEEQKIEAHEIKKHSLVPVIEEKPTVETIQKPIFDNIPKPIVKLPEESELDDDDDDDLNKIKTKIMETMSKIEQAEVD